MKEIDFYKLPRNLQDNLLESFRAEFDPKPILSRRGVRPTAYAWLALAAGAALLLTVLCLAGFGKIDSPLALHPIAAIAAYIALAATTAVGIAQALALRAATSALPFPTGAYLFPATLIDARDQKLGILSLRELTSVAARGGAVVTRFGVREYVFPLPAEHLDHAVKLVEEARAHLDVEVDDAERRKLDPLEPPVVANPLASTVPLPNKTPSWVKLRFVVVALVGLAAGAGLFQFRNTRSDAKMFAFAKARDDVASYQAYLARGRDHRDMVARELLPRAELRIAIADGSVEAIDGFIRAYPDTAIGEEVAQARGGAMLAAFEAANRKGTLAALQTFADSYPDHGLPARLATARHAIYVKALERYKAQAPAGTEATTAFVEQLLVVAERLGARKTPDGIRGPTVEIRVAREGSKELKRSDDLVQKNPMYTGVKSLPSRYLDKTHLEPSELAIAKSLARALGSAFDPEVIVIAPGERVDDDAADRLPASPTPTLFVTYRVEPSGSAYASKKPMGIYVGLLFYFKFDFVLPGGGEPLREKFNFVQRIPLEILRKVDKVPPAGTLEKEIYETMSREAFAEAEKRYLAMWVPPP